VGTVVRTAEDEAPVGVMSVLNLRTYTALPALAQTLAHLKAKADAATKPALEAALSAAAAGKAGARTGLVVSERLVNCPPQLCEPLTGSLMDEIQWATEDEVSMPMPSHPLPCTVPTCVCCFTGMKCKMVGNNRVLTNATGCSRRRPNGNRSSSTGTWC
jgi:hypothetical protein